MKSMWKYILIAIAAVCVIILVVWAVYLQLKKRVIGEELIILTEEDARDGVTAHITVKYKSSRAKLELDIPPNVRDGQKFLIRDVVFYDENGQKAKKKLCIQVKIV